MERPDLTSLACVNPACQQFRQAGQGHLAIRKVHGRDRLRPLRCRICGEELSERRGSALFNTKLPATKAAAVITHLDEGCSVRATARLVKGSQEPVARLLRVSGRHAERLHDQPVHDLRPLALAFDEPWSVVKKSKHAVRIMSEGQLAICGTIRRWPRAASSSPSYYLQTTIFQPLTRHFSSCKKDSLWLKLRIYIPIFCNKRYSFMSFWLQRERLWMRECSSSKTG